MGAAMYMVFYSIGIVQLLSKDRFLPKDVVQIRLHNKTLYCS